MTKKLNMGEKCELCGGAVKLTGRERAAWHDTFRGGYNTQFEYSCANPDCESLSQWLPTGES